MFLITGATGNVGGEIVRQLRGAGSPVRVFTRDRKKLTGLDASVEAAEGDFRDANSFERAVAGTDYVFLMSNDPDVASFRNLLSRVKPGQIRKLVFLSTLAANDEHSAIGKLHTQKEDAIREAGLRASFLRPGGFMSNSLRWADSIRSQGLVYNPMGEGKFAPVAPEDIASVAVRALQDEAQSILEITGNEVVSVPEQVAILARVLGKPPIGCVDVSIEAAEREMIRSGIPQAMAAAAAESFQRVREGAFAGAQDTVERVTSNQPMGFEAWVHKHIKSFQ
jgi:uncharacterized protein YbjT (DUF2867 family)